MIASVAVALALAIVEPRPGAPVPYLPVPRGAVVLLRTSSTNSVGYRIVVARNGEAEYVRAGGERVKTSLAASYVSTLFSDLSRAMPLSHIAAQRCAHSVSFGYSVFAWWQGQRSPDLTCAPDVRGKAIAGDVDAIAHALGVARSPGLMIPMPRELHRAPPSPSPTPPG